MKKFIKRGFSFITTSLVTFSSTIGIVRGTDNNPFYGATDRSGLSFSNAWKANSTDYDGFIDALNEDEKPNLLVRMPYTLTNRVSNNPKTAGCILVGVPAGTGILWYILRQKPEGKLELDADYGGDDMELDDGNTLEINA